MTDCRKCGHPTDPADPQPCEAGGVCLTLEETPGFVSVCQFCGAETEPMMIDDAGDSWSVPLLFGYAAIKRHQSSGECPGPPPEQPGVHLRPAGPNYGPGTHPDPTRPSERP